MSYHPRRILTPGATRKRKEREAFYSVKPSTTPPPSPPPQVAVTNTNTIPTTTTSSKPAEPVSSNRLLAGYMAYEFLTKGTLFGQKFDPSRGEALPLSSSGADPRREKPGHSQRGEDEPGGKVKPYAEVASLLKGEGAHVPGIVNPMQLARWIQM